ncbi:MAG: GatB/YqeY domain-containing protein [Myxococcota bacterium]
MLERVSEHLQAAMKARDRHRIRALRLAKTRLADATRYGVNAATVRTILASMLAESEEQLTTYARAGREDLADAEVAEVAVYEELLRELDG